MKFVEWLKILSMTLPHEHLYFFTPTVCKHKSVLFLEDGKVEDEMRSLSLHNVWA